MKNNFLEKDQSPFAVGNFTEAQTRPGQSIEIGTKVYMVHSRTLRIEAAPVGGGVSAVIPAEYVCLVYPTFDNTTNQPIPAPNWV